MKTKVYENSLRAQSCEEIIARSRLASRFREAVILPIPSTKDGVFVNGSDERLFDVLSDVGTSTLVLGYGIPDDIKEVAARSGAAVCDSACDESFLAENAELTALATLGILLTTEKRAPADMKIGIVGYGRIGKCLTRILLYLGAYVKVYTSRDDVRLELAEAGISSDVSRDGADFDDVDILINTAPAHIFDTTEGGDLRAELRVIDLASGDNFPGFMSVEKYPSVPARMFPVSAGRLWAQSAERFLLLGESFGEEAR